MVGKVDRQGFKLKRLKTASLICAALLLMCYVFVRFGNRRNKEPLPEFTQHKKTEMEVVTFNTHLLPPLAMRLAGKRSMARYRCEKIAERLSTYDIVGLSELFDEKLSSQMIRQFNSHQDHEFHFIRSPPPLGVFQFSSGGLVFFSRFPIIDQNHLTFRRGSRFLSTWFQAADGLAAKGALHVTLKIDRTKRLDCYLAHLESYSAKIRKEQVKELTEFVQTTRSSGAPFLLMGDFNISGPLKQTSSEFIEYNELVSGFESEAFEIIDIALTAGQADMAGGTSDAIEDSGGDRIDYVFLGVPAGFDFRRNIESKTLRLFDRNVAKGSLSDHAAVWARIPLFNESHD